jgi:hypothetical protein
MISTFSLSLSVSANHKRCVYGEEEEEDGE